MHALAVRLQFQSGGLLEKHYYVKHNKMLIEIKDREPYIKRCKTKLQRIKMVRAKKDKQYEEQWRREWPWRYWRKETDMPPERFPFYPAIDGWRQQEIVSQVLEALESEGTGIIQITKEELDYLN